ncbi:hypothetical protein D3C72_2554250 [compost metagenome]
MFAGELLEDDFGPVAELELVEQRGQLGEYADQRFDIGAIDDKFHGGPAPRVR